MSNSPSEQEKTYGQNLGGRLLRAGDLGRDYVFPFAISLNRPGLYWQDLISSFTKPGSGLGGRLEAVGTILKAHEKMLKRFAKKDSLQVAAFIREGQNQLLTALKASDRPELRLIYLQQFRMMEGLRPEPRRTTNVESVAQPQTPEWLEKLEAEQQSAATNSSITAGDPGRVDLPNVHTAIDEQRWNQPQKFLEEITSMLSDPVYGAGAKADLSDVLPERFQRLIEFSRGKDDTAFYNLVNLTLSDFSAFLKKNSSAQAYQRIDQMFGQFNNLALAARYAKKAVEIMLRKKDGAATKPRSVDNIATLKHPDSTVTPNQYYNNYLTALENPNSGFGAKKADFSPTIQTIHASVIQEVSTKEINFQADFVKGMIDTGLAFLEKSPDKSADLTTLVMKDLLSLLSDSPIAQAIIAGEAKGQGREEQKLKPLQRYFIDKILASSQSIELVKSLGHFIASKDTTRTTEQKQFCQYILWAVRENCLKFGAKNKLNDDKIKTFRASQTAALEKLTYRLETTGLTQQTLTDMMLALKSISPRALAELALILGQGGQLAKTLRYNQDRSLAARQPESVDVNLLGNFYAGFRAGGKMVADTLPTFPPDQELLTHLSIPIITEKLTKEHEKSELTKVDFSMAEVLAGIIGNNDKLTGLGDVIPGAAWLLYPSAERKADQPETLWQCVQQELIYSLYFNQIIGEHGRVEEFLKDGPNKLSGEIGVSREQLAAFELFEVGIVLKDFKGEDNPLKEKARETYLSLLVKILGKTSPTTSYNENKSHIGQVALKIVERVLPYWPLKEQQRFVDLLANKAYLDTPTLVDHGHWKDIVMRLAVNKQKLPPVIDEDQIGLRPISPYILEKTQELLKIYPVIEGPSHRRSLLLDFLGIKKSQIAASQAPTTIKTLVDINNVPNSFLVQAIDIQKLLSFYKPKEGSPKTKRPMTINAAIQDACQEDLRIILASQDPPPRISPEFVQAAQQMRDNLVGAFDQAAVLYMQTLKHLLGAKTDDVFSAVSTKVTADSPVGKLLAELRTETDKKMEKLRESVQMNRTENLAKAANDGVQKNITDQGDPIASIERAIAPFIHLEEGMIDPEVAKLTENALKVLQERARAGSTIGLTNDGVDVPRHPMAIAAWGLASWMMGQGYTTITAIPEASFAARDIVEALLKDQQLSRQLFIGLAKEVGYTDLVGHKTQVSEEVFANLISHLANEKDRQALVRNTQYQIDDEIVRAIMLGKTLETIIPRFQNKAITLGIQEKFQPLIIALGFQLSLMQRRISAARTANIKFAAMMGQMGKKIGDVTDDTVKTVLDTGYRTFGWFKRNAGDQSPTAQLAQHVEAILWSMGIQLSIPLPTPADFLGGDLSEAPITQISLTSDTNASDTKAREQIVDV